MMRHIAFLLSLILCVTAAIAKTPWKNVVRRTTNHRNHDLIHALNATQRFDEAEALCREAASHADPQSDEAARWAIRISQVLTSRQLLASTFEDTAIQKAQKPVTDLLQSYPKHPRALFMRVQLAAVGKAAARHRVLIVSVSPPNEQLTDAAMSSLASATRLFTALRKEIVETRSSINSRQSTLTEKALSTDLLRLQHQVRSDTVGMALMQTNLFASGSRDQIGAAASAKREADQALQELPNNSVVRREIHRMRVDAILRTGDYAAAETELTDLVRRFGKPVPANVWSMAVQLDLLRGRVEDAEKKLIAFYGADPTTAPLSVEMDLVRLEYLMARNDPDIGDWLDSIEQRHGGYARRRAEAVSLARVRGSGTVNTVDPSLIAAQGQEWLRRGDPQRAGTLLGAAAKAEQNADRAIQRASQAAAAFIKAGRKHDAAAILSSTAIANARGKNAAALHLQAAVVLTSEAAAISTSDGKKAEEAAFVEKILADTHSQWPETDVAANARKWLLLLYRRQKRNLEAALASTRFLDERSSQAEVDQALAFWETLILNSDESSLPERIMNFQTAFEKHQTAANIQSRYPFSAALILEQSGLVRLPRKLHPLSDMDRFAESLLKFRRDQTSTPALLSPPETVVPLATWRLMRDAQMQSKLRRPVASLIKTWKIDSAITRAIVLVWLGETDEAIKLIAATASGAKQPTVLWRQLATTLSDTGSANNRLAAIGVWERLASGLPKSSAPWHNAKVAAIELMLQAGQTDEAVRRAKYIMLTNRPADRELKERYEAIIHQ